MSDRPRTQKSTKVTEEERVQALPDLKAEIRRTDPNLSSQEVERRALVAAGLPTGEDVNLDDVPEGGRGRAAARSAGRVGQRAGGRAKKVVTSSGARKVIFGVMGLSLAIGVFRDFRSGRALTTDVVPRRLIGTFIGTLMLMVLAGPAPRVARGLAILVGFTVIAFNQKVIETITTSALQEGEQRTSGDDESPNVNTDPETTIEFDRPEDRDRLR